MTTSKFDYVIAPTDVENAKKGLYAKEVDEYVHCLEMLDYFAKRLDDYAKCNMLSGDETVSSILYEFNQLMPIDATRIKQTDNDKSL